MTEEEARAKWCPATRMRTLYDVSARLGEADRDAHLNCIASACMAWRWQWAHDGSFNTTLSGPTLEVVERVPNFRVTEHGYCGLAGSPR